MTIRAEWILLGAMIGPKSLSPEDRRELLACVKRQRGDHGIARRANALLSLDDGKSRAEIAGVLHLDDDTVRGWRKPYLAEGWKGGQSRMTGRKGPGLATGLRGAFAGRPMKSAPIFAQDLASAIPIRAV